MAETKPKRQPQKIADITKPGKTAPNSSARPVIIPHRSVLTDPMMVQDITTPDDKSNTKDATPVTHMSHSIKLQPLHDDVAAEEAPATPGAPAIAADVKAGKTIAVLADEAAKRRDAKGAEEKGGEAEEASAGTEEQAVESEATTEPTGAPTVEPEKIASDVPPPQSAEPVAETAKPTTEPPDDAATRPVADEVTTSAPEPVDKPDETPAEAPDNIPKEDATDAPAATELPLGEDSIKSSGDNEPTDTNLSEADQKAANEAKKVAEEQEKIIASGKYYLPINAVAHRRTKQHIAVGLVVILLLAVALFLAVWDAGLFSIPGYTAPTDYL